jgi:hypothetical protein
LVHDIGNIVKFSFVPGTLHYYGEEASRIEYWQEVKEKTIREYGSGEAQVVTDRMLIELGTSEKLRVFATQTTPKTITYVANSPDFDLKIFVHSDQRAAPHGMVNVEKRIEDIQERMKGRDDEAELTFSDALKGPSLRLQEQIFRNTCILPWQINDTKVAPYVRRFMRK